MSKIFVFISLILFSPSMWAFDHNHRPWTSLLSKYVNDKGFVDYKAWQKQQKPLDDYLESLESVGFKEYQKFSSQQKKAFLINAYNAFTIKLILKHYPVESIKDIGGFFTKPWSVEFFKLLDGKIESLDPIEHEWLRNKPELRDPRVHAAVNCASISCPPLNPTAFQADILDSQLASVTRSWINDSSRNRISSKELKLSKIFDWFKEDFGGNEEGIKNFLMKYLPPDKARALAGRKVEISFLDYDWGLNKQ